MVAFVSIFWSFFIINRTFYFVIFINPFDCVNIFEFWFRLLGVVLIHFDVVLALADPVSFCTHFRQLPVHLRLLYSLLLSCFFCFVIVYFLVLLRFLCYCSILSKFQELVVDCMSFEWKHVSAVLRW
jgi:hypothetical protein